MKKKKSGVKVHPTIIMETIVMSKHVLTEQEIKEIYNDGKSIMDTKK